MFMQQVACLSMEPVSCTWTCKVGPSRFIPQYCRIKKRARKEAIPLMWIFKLMLVGVRGQNRQPLRCCHTWLMKHPRCKTSLIGQHIHLILFQFLLGSMFCFYLLLYLLLCLVISLFYFFCHPWVHHDLAKCCVYLGHFASPSSGASWSF